MARSTVAAMSEDTNHDTSTASISEHRRAQNRLSQRRYRQRQNQQKTASEQRPPPTRMSRADSLPSTIHPLVSYSTDFRPSQIQNYLTNELQRDPYNFGAGCLLGINSGMPGLQRTPDMDGLDEFMSGHMYEPFIATAVPSSLDGWSSECTDSSAGYTHPSLHSSGSSSRTTEPAEEEEEEEAEEELEDQYQYQDHGSSWVLPLHIAARNGHYRVVRVLLQNLTDCNEADSEGSTPLIHATIAGHEDVAMLLLDHGADIRKGDGQSRTALHWAVIHRRETLLKILLEHCHEDQDLLNAYDRHGKTPVHIAADTGFDAGMAALLLSGADMYSRATKRLSLSPPVHAGKTKKV